MWMSSGYIVIQNSNLVTLISGFRLTFIDTEWHVVLYRVGVNSLIYGFQCHLKHSLDIIISTSKLVFLVVG